MYFGLVIYNMLYLLPYLILPPISKKLFGDIGLDDDDDDDDDIDFILLYNVRIIF